MALRRQALRPRPPKRLIRPDHLEHVFRLDLEIVAAAAGADDRLGQAVW